MIDLRKLFLRDARHAGRSGEPDSDYHPSGRRGEGLEVEYQTLIATLFQRWGISTSAVTVEVRQIGRAPDGFDVFVGLVRLGRWDRISALRLLLGLPLLEAKLRKMVRSTWMADFSHFAGLWLHTSEQLSHTPARTELRDLMMQLTPVAPAAAAPDFGATGDYTSQAASLRPAPTGSGLPTTGAAPLSEAGVAPGDAPVTG